jgi:hypothetical protein
VPDTHWLAMTEDQRRAKIERAVRGRARATARRRVLGWLEAGHLDPSARHELAKLLLADLDQSSS